MGCGSVPTARTPSPPLPRQRGLSPAEAPPLGGARGAACSEDRPVMGCGGGGVLRGAQALRGCRGPRSGKTHRPRPDGRLGKTGVFCFALWNFECTFHVLLSVSLTSKVNLEKDCPSHRLPEVVFKVRPPAPALGAGPKLEASGDPPPEPTPGPDAPQGSSSELRGPPARVPSPGPRGGGSPPSGPSASAHRSLLTCAPHPGGVLVTGRPRQQAPAGPCRSPLSCGRPRALSQTGREGGGPRPRLRP